MGDNELFFRVFIGAIAAVFGLIFYLLSEEKKKRKKRTKNVKQDAYSSSGYRARSRNKRHKKDMIEALENGEIKFEIAMNSADKFNVLEWVINFTKFMNKPIAMQLLGLEGSRKYE